MAEKDHDQDRRLDKHESEIGALKTDVAGLTMESALMKQSVENIGEKFDTGMQTLSGEIRAQITGYRADAKATRENELLLAQQGREDRKWWWGKVFAIITSVLGAGAAGGGAWYAFTDKPAPEPAAIEAPRPAPSEVAP